MTLLAQRLVKDGQKHVCLRDTDCKIVEVAVGKAKLTEVMVIAHDSEVATSLLYYWDESLFDIYFNQERDKKCWGIKAQGRKPSQWYLL